MTRFVAALLLAVFASFADGASPDPKDLAIPPQELSKARELIKRLGSEVYREREEAHAELAKMGRLARPALVEAGPGGTPKVVNRELVTVVREEWRVVDRWWTDEPVDRRYFEVVLESGQNVCVYRDREEGCWFTQKA